jgi:tetratricopeptide (TPR) repeat protein
MNMRMMFRPGRGAQWVLLAGYFGLAGAAHAECIGPMALMSKLRAQPSSENAVQLGNWFASNKQFECAAETFRNALKTDPESAQLHYLEGLALAGSGHPSEAVSAVQEAARIQPDAIKPHLLLATLYNQAGKYEEADGEWKQALTIDPKSSIALEGQSSSLLARKDYVGAIGVLQHAPRTETLTLHLAEALENLNYIDGANDVLLEAMKLSPNSLPLANAESAVLMKKRSYLEAVKLWSYMVDHHPGNREAEMHYLSILVMTQHYALARPLGLKLLAQMPHNWEVLYLNGVEDHQVGDFQIAKAHLEEAVALVPDFYYSRYYLGATLVTLREWKEARENLEKAIALGDTEPEVHYRLGMALHGLGENDLADAQIKQYQDLKKTAADTLEANLRATQADGELAAGSVQEAIGHYREACDTAPMDGNFKYKLALALNKAGDLDGERTQLEEAVKLNPEMAAAQKQLGFLLARSGDADGAIEHFGLAVRNAPGWVDAWVNLAAELAVAARFPEARKAVTMALRLDPTNEQARKLSDRLAHDPAAQQPQR